MSKSIQAIRGMNDLLPQDALLWQFLEDSTRAVFEQYGYQLMRTPLVESTALFVRSLGEVTDVVEKEMYSFEDAMNGEKLTLRPEATAGLVRAAIEHNLLYDGPKRVWTWGPMFRHERPQKGRYRQFHQFDVEALGFAGPDVDAEQMIMLSRLWRNLGFEQVTLHINSIGDIPARQAHRAALIAYFESHLDELDADAKRRLYTNPLRTLDSKNPAMQSLIESAPKLETFLGADEQAHFDGLKSRLDKAGVKYNVNSRLVRGFDYYNRTVFEFVGKGKDWELAIAGGGRYDGLLQAMGGKSAPACGFGIGVERVMLLLAETSMRPPQMLDAYVVHSAEASDYAVKVAESLRDQKLSVAVHATADGLSGSFKSQMKKADASGARFAIIMGAEELAQGLVTLKDLSNSEQRRLSLSEAVTLMQGSDSI